jgi:hypothetical protein
MAPMPLRRGVLVAIRAISIPRHYRPGEVVLEAGDQLDRFVPNKESELQAANLMTVERLVPATLKAGKFMGQLSSLNGGPMTLTMRPCAPTHDRIAACGLRGLMSEVRQISDPVLTVFSARRRRIFEAADSSMAVAGERKREFRTRSGAQLVRLAPCFGLSKPFPTSATVPFATALATHAGVSRRPATNCGWGNLYRRASS